MEFNGRISIVIPVFNEESNIQLVYDEVVKELLKITNDYEIIFVDDGSNDDTSANVKKIALLDSKVSCLIFSRNFGQQMALNAGLDYASGKIIISMDGDLQHPPQLIPEMVEQYLLGYQIVNTSREYKTSVGFFKRISSSIFYKFLNRLSEIKIEPDAADFRLISREALQEYRKLKEKNRFNRGLISWLGFEQTSVAYVAQKRHSGETKYSFHKLMILGIDAVTSFSAKPLRMVSAIGTAIFIFGLIYGIYAIIQYFLGQNSPGWTSILISILIIGGFQILAIGIIGEYIARIFTETKNRPPYIVKEIIGEAQKQ